MRVALGDRDLQQVPREDLRRSGDRAGVDELLHVGLVGRREDVGRRALADLLDERRRAREVEARPWCRDDVDSKAVATARNEEP